MPKVTIMPDLCRCDLHQDAVIMAICIAKYAKYETMTAFPSNRTLMRETRFNRARLNRTKRLMTEANIMTIETRYDDAGDMTSNLYTLNNKFIRLGHESGGVTVDTEILSSELTAKEVALLLTIAWGASNKTANPTNKAICEAMGIGAAMLTALKNSLIEKGMIECEPSFKDGKGQTANKITIVANCISPPCENRTYPPTKIEPTPLRKSTPPPLEKHTPPPLEKHTHPPLEKHTHPPLENRTPNKKLIVNKEKEIVNKEEEATFSKIEKSKKEKTKLGAALNCKASEHIEPCDILHGQNIGIGELLSDNQYNALVTLHAPAIVQELQMKGILSLTSEELVKVAVTRVIAFAESKAIDMSKTGHFAQTLNWGLTAAKEQYSKQTTNKNATYQPTAQTIANIAAYCNYIAAASRQH